MQVENTKKTLISRTLFKIVWKTWKFLVQRNNKAAREKERAQQRTIEENHGSRCGASHPDTSRIDSVGSLQNETIMQNNENSYLRFEERIIRRKVSLPCGSVEEQVIYARRVNLCSSDNRLQIWFDLYQEHFSQENIFSHFQHLESLDDQSQTRIVDGLLTTTLCSTEL